MKQYEENLCPVPENLHNQLMMTLNGLSPQRASSMLEMSPSEINEIMSSIEDSAQKWAEEIIKKHRKNSENLQNNIFYSNSENVQNDIKGSQSLQITRKVSMNKDFIP